MATLQGRTDANYNTDRLNLRIGVRVDIIIGYDVDGNLTSDGTISYSYDAENRLTGASETGMSATYLYKKELGSE